MEPCRTPTFEARSGRRRIWKEMVQEVGREQGENGAVKSVRQESEKEDVISIRSQESK